LDPGGNGGGATLSLRAASAPSSNSELPFTRMANDFAAASLNLSIAGIQSKQCLRVLETMMALEWKGNLAFVFEV
jgi:hypothetical protein